MAEAQFDIPAPLETRLERGDVVSLPACPFPVPAGDDLHFLLAQSLGGGRHKNISYDPVTGRVAGFRRRSEAQASRLRGLLAAFADHAATWLAGAAPGYAAALRRDRVSFRPEEEATRCLRLHARNDLLHIDAFPSRPTSGDRILRLFANINPIDPRVWMTSHTFPRLLERYGHEAGLPTGNRTGWVRQIGRAVRGLFGGRRRTTYDDFMLRFHHFLKRSYHFQEKGPRRFWTFAPGSAWLAFTDGISHAEMRGQFALEHTFFVPVAALRHPELSPVRLLEAVCQGLPLAA
jgi:hypothetical protein